MCRHVTVINNGFNQHHLQAIVAMSLRCSADEENNKHGTGIAYKQAILKKGSSASTFLDDKDSIEFLQKWDSKVLIGHVRKASIAVQKGVVKEYPDNHAHPFVLNNIMLAHNGTIINWREVLDGISAEIDSQMMAEKLNRLESWDIESLNNVSKEFLGSFTCIFRRPDSEELYFCTHIRSLYRIEIVSEDGTAFILCTSQKAVEKAITLVYESLKYATRATWVWKTLKVKENIWGKMSPEGMPISLGDLEFKVLPKMAPSKISTPLSTKDVRIERAKLLVEISTALAISFKEVIRYVNILFYNEPLDYPVTLEMAKLAHRFYEEVVRCDPELLDELYTKCVDAKQLE